MAKPILQELPEKFLIKQVIYRRVTKPKNEKPIKTELLKEEQLAKRIEILDQSNIQQTMVYYVEFRCSF